MDRRRLDSLRSRRGRGGERSLDILDVAHPVRRVFDPVRLRRRGKGVGQRRPRDRQQGRVGDQHCGAAHPRHGFKQQLCALVHCFNAGEHRGSGQVAPRPGVRVDQPTFDRQESLAEDDGHCACGECRRSCREGARGDQQLGAEPTQQRVGQCGHAVHALVRILLLDQQILATDPTELVPRLDRGRERFGPPPRVRQPAESRSDRRW